MKWQDVLRNSVKGDTIKAGALRKIPHLRSCPMWDHAVFLGRVSYDIKVANYDGGLVKYEGRIYYVNKAQIETLSNWVRWDLKKEITVLED